MYAFTYEELKNVLSEFAQHCGLDDYEEDELEDFVSKWMEENSDLDQYEDDSAFEHC